MVTEMLITAQYQNHLRTVLLRIRKIAEDDLMEQMKLHRHNTVHWLVTPTKANGETEVGMRTPRWLKLKIKYCLTREMSTSNPGFSSLERKSNLSPFQALGQWRRLSKNAGGRQAGTAGTKTQLIACPLIWSYPLTQSLKRAYIRFLL